MFINTYILFILMKYEELNLNKILFENLLKNEILYLTNIQKISYQKILEKKNIIGISPTGSGKTLAYLVPVINSLILQEEAYKSKKNKILILAPTRELCVQIQKVIDLLLVSLDISCLSLYGNEKNSSKLNEKIEEDILISTPVKLKELVENRVINLDNLQYFIIDEIDLILDKNNIDLLKFLFKKIPFSSEKLFFSATFTDKFNILEDFNLNKFEIIEVKEDKINLDLITHYSFFVDEHNKKKLLLDILNKKEVKSGIIFVDTKKKADDLVRFLVENKIKTEAIHSSKSSFHRFKVINNLKSRKYKFIVSTDLISRGIDIEDLTHIINYSFPKNIIDYTHKIGRVGRNGMKGEIYNLISKQEYDELKKIENKFNIINKKHQYHADFSLKSESKKIKKKK